MTKEHFLYDETPRLLKLLDETARRSGMSRGHAFEDFLHMSVCALSAGQLEDQYMQIVKKHAEGRKGRRGCDSIAQMFGDAIVLDLLLRMISSAGSN